MSEHDSANRLAPAMPEHELKIHVISTHVTAPAILALVSKLNDETGVEAMASCLGGNEGSAEIRLALSAWDRLRERTKRGTRFNDPLRFQRASQNTDDGQRHPVAVVIMLGAEAVASVFAFLVNRDNSYASDSLGNRAPRITSLSIGETAILTDGSEDGVQGVCSVLRSVLSTGTCQVLAIDNIPSHDPLLNELTKIGRVTTRSRSRWLRQLIDESTDKPILHGSAKTRSTMRRKHKVLRKHFDGDLKFVRITDSAETTDFAVKAADIVAQTYQAALGIGVDDNPQLVAYLHEMADDGHLRAYLLEGRGEAIAYIVGDLEAKTFHLWATSFVPEFSRFSPGSILLNLVIDDLTSENALQFDFGWGEARYKRVFGSEQQSEVDLLCFGRGVRPFVAFHLDRTIARARDSLDRILRSTGVRSRARKMWRRILNRHHNRSGHGQVSN